MVGSNVWFPQLIALITVGLILLSFQLYDFNKTLSIFMVYLSLNYVFVCQLHPRAMLCLLCAFAGCFIAKAMSKQKQTGLFYNIFIFLAIVQFFYVIAQYFGHDPFFSSVYNSNVKEITGVVGSHNQLGIYSSTLSVLLLSVCIYAPLVIIIPIILCKTSTAMIAALVGCLLYMVINKDYLKVIALCVMVLSGMFIWKNFDNNTFDSYKERLGIWKLTLDQAVSGKSILYGKEGFQVVKSNPLVGYGLGSFMVNSPASQDKLLVAVRHRYEHAHNDILEAFYEFGYIGSFLIFCLILGCLRAYLGVINKTKQLNIVFCSLVVFAVCSLGVYVFHAPVSYFMFMIFFGLFHAEVRNASKSVQEA